MSRNEGSRRGMKYSDWLMVVSRSSREQQGAAHVREGAYAEYIAVSTHMLIHKPKELSWEQAAGIPEVSSPASYLVWSPLMSHRPG